MQSLNFRFSINVDQATAGKSSLLIPALELGFFNNRIKDLGSTAAYFSWMIEHCLPYLPEIRSQINQYKQASWTTTYQKRGLDLEKRSFTPSGKDWESFRHAALACGVSICCLFVFIMILEAEGFFQKIMYKKSLERNSSPNRPKKTKKLRKFSKLERIFEEKTQTLHRILEIR